jgi:hypothetical protein
MKLRELRAIDSFLETGKPVSHASSEGKANRQRTDTKEFSNLDTNYLDNKLRQFGFIGMCRFFDQSEGQDGERLYRKQEVSTTFAKHVR